MRHSPLLPPSTPSSSLASCHGMTYSLALLLSPRFLLSSSSVRCSTTSSWLHHGFPMHAPARLLQRSVFCPLLFSCNALFFLLFFSTPPRCSVLSASRPFFLLFFRPSQRDHDHGSLRCISHAVGSHFSAFHPHVPRKSRSSSQESIIILFHASRSHFPHFHHDHRLIKSSFVRLLFPAFCFFSPPFLLCPRS